MLVREEGCDGRIALRLPLRPTREAWRLGRFLQPDPIGYGDGLSWYDYAASDPVNRTDPSGTNVCASNGLVTAIQGSSSTDWVTIDGVWTQEYVATADICGGPSWLTTTTISYNRTDDLFGRLAPTESGFCPKEDDGSVIDSLLYVTEFVGTTADVVSVGAEVEAGLTGEITPPALAGHTVAGVSNIISKLTSLAALPLHFLKRDYVGMVGDTVGMITSNRVGKLFDEMLKGRKFGRTFSTGADKLAGKLGQQTGKSRAGCSG